MGFLDPTTDFRWILPTETDANSPISEELMSQIRENTESNTLNRIYSGYRAKVVSRDSDTQLTITKINSGDPDWRANIAANLVITFRSGGILGENFEVASNTALTTGNATLVITGGTFPAGEPGVDDELLVMYAQTGQAHTHDGLNSAPLAVKAVAWHLYSPFRNGTQWNAATWYPQYSSTTVLAYNSNPTAPYQSNASVSSLATAPIQSFVYTTSRRKLTFSIKWRATNFFNNDPISFRIIVPAQTVYLNGGGTAGPSTQITSPTYSYDFGANTPGINDTVDFVLPDDYAADLTTGNLLEGHSYNAYFEIMTTTTYGTNQLYMWDYKGYIE